METRIFCEIPSSFHSFQTIARILISLFVSVMEVRSRRHGGITYLHCVYVVCNSCRILLPYTKLKNLMLWSWIHVTNWRNHLFISLYLWFCSLWRISLSSDFWVVLVALSAGLGHNFLFCLCRNLKEETLSSNNESIKITKSGTKIYPLFGQNLNDEN